MHRAVSSEGGTISGAATLLIRASSPLPIPQIYRQCCVKVQLEFIASAGQPHFAQHSELLKEIEVMRQSYEQEHSIRRQVEWLPAECSEHSYSLQLAPAPAAVLPMLLSCSWQVMCSLVLLRPTAFVARVRPVGKS